LSNNRLISETIKTTEEVLTPWHTFTVEDHKLIRWIRQTCYNAKIIKTTEETCKSQKEITDKYQIHVQYSFSILI